MIYTILPTVLFMLASFSPNETSFSEPKNVKPIVYAKTLETSDEAKIEIAYNNLHSDKFALPKLESFSVALKGYYSLKEKGLIKKDILTLIDFSLSSNTKRLWVIDLITGDVLFHSLVAHGRNTGEEFASNFSNASESYKSSLGFYSTGEMYNGKHGMSLRLDGLEKGVNDNARARGVVMHAADYVSNSFIKNNHRLGRSQGCPAVPVELSKEIISTIKNKSCFFIYHPSRVSKFGAESIS
ncbi:MULTISPECIES: murein L,D-transpeptidase catalytic domain family protein [Flavobacterium]|uniref:Murein L,D-transpeptidase catalytic domain family protein n=1 Tax=Flavobacterium ranwuense TaxID=2541725 RepID=A0ABY2DRW7_9FLAO|nr:MULTISPECIES: murein L,D-transpeptidase catalytic domain family protein [Flavobacterium]TDE29695.1 murein L,D-transpeptidase catalytic domain family protein [Flavobacterium ranwuense]TDE54177.1 murein L,D-transpeptidase catalytic domain family protein [Flavobacterium sp. GT3P67]